jgi:hypothetical protein
MSKVSLALDKLRDTIFETFQVLAADDDDRTRHMDEYQQRQIALRGIDDILEGRPLIQFSAAHLDLLELLFAYWRLLEVEGDPRRPPEPAGPEGLMSVWQGALPLTPRHHGE